MHRKRIREARDMQRAGECTYIEYLCYVARTLANHHGRAINCNRHLWTGKFAPSTVQMVLPC